MSVVMPARSGLRCEGLGVGWGWGLGVGVGGGRWGVDEGRDEDSQAAGREKETQAMRNAYGHYGVGEVAEGGGHGGLRQMCTLM
jgi:hypothetical protein